MFNRALITTDGTDWFVAAEGYDALGPRPGVNKPGIGQPEADLDQPSPMLKAGAAASDPELEAANRRRSNGAGRRAPATTAKQAEVIRMLQRPRAQPSARSAPPPVGRRTRCAAPSPGLSRRSWA